MIFFRLQVRSWKLRNLLQEPTRDPKFWPAHAPKDLQVNYRIFMRRKYLLCVSHCTKCNTIFNVSFKVWDPPTLSAQATQAPSAARQVHLFSQGVITCDQKFRPFDFHMSTLTEELQVPVEVESLIEGKDF